MKAFAALLLALCFSQPAFADDREGEMVAVIKEVGAGANLRDIAAQAILRSQTYKSLVKKMGKTKAEDTIAHELDVNTPKYQDDWDKNLADTYLQFFAPDEMRSIFTQKKDSPYAAKYEEQRTEIGTEMQKKSEPIVKRLMVEVLTASTDDAAAKK